VLKMIEELPVNWWNDRAIGGITGKTGEVVEKTREVIAQAKEVSEKTGEMTVQAGKMNEKTGEMTAPAGGVSEKTREMIVQNGEVFEKTGEMIAHAGERLHKLGNGCVNVGCRSSCPAPVINVCEHAIKITKTMEDNKMIRLKKTIATFLRDSKALIYGVKDDPFIKERILAYNIDNARIEESVKLYEEAVKAESDKSKEYGEQLEARKRFEKTMDEADYIFKKHSDFVRLALRDDEEKINKLFLSGEPRSRKISDILKYMMEFYNRVLADDQVVAGVSAYGITKEDLEKGLQKIVEADTAKTAHNVEMGESQDATDRRDKAFNQLIFITEELEIICTYALEDRPQLLEKFGITVLSEGYKRKNKESSEPTDNPE
jgi:hypothetical protein